MINCPSWYHQHPQQSIVCICLFTNNLIIKCVSITFLSNIYFIKYSLKIICFNTQAYTFNEVNSADVEHLISYYNVIKTSRLFTTISRHNTVQSLHKIELLTLSDLIQFAYHCFRMVEVKKRAYQCKIVYNCNLIS